MIVDGFDDEQPPDDKTKTSQVWYHSKRIDSNTRAKLVETDCETICFFA